MLSIQPGGSSTHGPTPGGPTTGGTSSSNYQGSPPVSRDGSRTWFRPHQADTKVRDLRPLPKTPRVVLTPEVHERMGYWVGCCNLEISWLGTVEKLEGEVYLIDRVFLLEQEVDHTVTDIDELGAGKLAQELLSQGAEGVEVIKRLRYWGHSHVRMSTHPSGQDDRTMESFRGNPWYVRGILNQEGKIRFDVYDFEQGLEWQDVSWTLLEPEDAQRDAILAEMEAKVSRRRWQPVQRGTEGRTAIANSGPAGNGSAAGTGRPKIDQFESRGDFTDWFARSQGGQPVGRGPYGGEDDWDDRIDDLYDYEVLARDPQGKPTLVAFRNDPDKLLTVIEEQDGKGKLTGLRFEDAETEEIQAAVGQGGSSGTGMYVDSDRELELLAQAKALMNDRANTEESTWNELTHRWEFADGTEDTS